MELQNSYGCNSKMDGIISGHTCTNEGDGYLQCYGHHYTSYISPRNDIVILLDIWACQKGFYKTGLSTGIGKILEVFRYSCYFFSSPP